MNDHSAVERTLKGNEDSEQPMLTDENGEEITAATIMKQMDFIGTKITEVSAPPKNSLMPTSFWSKQLLINN